jgi:uncharacterized protein YuzE
MRVTYDAEADAVYVYLVEIGTGEVVSGSALNREMEMGAVNADFNAEGKLVGIEVLGARRYVPQEALDRAERIG